MDHTDIDNVLDTLHFNDQGLVPAIAQDAGDGAVLMMAWMNRESIRATLETGEVTYWSRSRNELWRKGATSGHTQKLKSFRVDCDGDTLLVLVEQEGPACHLNTRTCFSRVVEPGGLAALPEDKQGYQL